MNINNVQFVKSIKNLNDRPLPLLPEAAIIGRSNVGKSSLINTIFNRKNLAKISSTPGKTKIINYFSVDQKLYLVDLPGYGFAKVAKKENQSWKNMIESYLIKNDYLRFVFLLIDCRHELSVLDKMMIDWLNNYKIHYYLVLTKKDKLSRNSFNKQFKKFEQAFSPAYLIAYSSKSRYGKEHILNILENMD